MAFGAIAQLGERYNGIVEVGGSIPPGSTRFALVATGNVGKPDIASFSPHRLEA